MIDTELPNDIEFFLISLGFYENMHAAKDKRHGEINKPKPRKKYLDATGWTPSHPNEEPPF